MYPNCKFPLVTLYGSKFIDNEWTIQCMESWENIKNLSKEDFYILPDSPLSKNEESIFKELNFKIVNLSQENLIVSFLEAYPSLKHIRKKDVTWRKLLDVAIIFKNAEKITIIDTDVYVNRAVTLPFEDCNLAYMREDIPAYKGRWDIVWKEKMVPALNAGIIIVNPKIIDFDYLEQITSKYLINCKNYWWTEQSAWSCIAGKVKKRLLFSGKQVRVISGTYKRTPLEISDNSYKYFGKKGMMKKYVEFEPSLEGGTIFHFAGPGKYMFQKSIDYLNTKKENGVLEITGEFEATLSFIDKMMISLRLYIKESFE